MSFGSVKAHNKAQISCGTSHMSMVSIPVYSPLANGCNTAVSDCHFHRQLYHAISFGGGRFRLAKDDTLGRIRNTGSEVTAPLLLPLAGCQSVACARC